MRLELPGARRRRKKRALVIALPLALLVIPAALLISRWFCCDPSQTIQQAKSRQEKRLIKRPHIGLLLPLDGPFSRQGKMLELGVKLAWQELQKLGIQGELIIRNSGTDFTTACRAAKELACDPQMLLVIAHLPAAELVEIIPTYHNEHLLLLTPANSHQNLVDHPWLLPLVSSDQSQAAWAAKIIQRWTVGKRAALIHSAESYGKLLSLAFQDEAQHIQLNFQTFTCGTEQASLDKAADDILRQNPAAVWLAGSPLWGSKLVQALVKRHYQGRFLAPASYGDPFVENLFSIYPDNFFMLRPVLVTDQGKGAMHDFCQAFRKAFWRTPNWLSVLGYDTMHWVGKALQLGPLSRTALRDYFLQADSPQHAYQGVGGPVYFDQNRQVHRPPHLAMWCNGRLEAAPASLY